jgi:hypothetical protein
MNGVGGLVPIEALSAAIGLGIALKFAPYFPVLFVTGAGAILASVRIILGKPSDSAYRYFCLTASLFVLAALWKVGSPLVAAAIVGWVFRGIMARIETTRKFVVSGFFAELGLAVIAWLLVSEHSLREISASEVSCVFFLLILSRGVSARLKWGNAILVGEAVSVGLLALLSIMNAEGIVYMRNPFHAMLIAAILAYFLRHGGILNRLPAWMFFMAGSLIFTSSGQEAFLFFFMFTMILNAGGRLWPNGGLFRLFNVSAALTALVSVSSIGSYDPFPFYFAISGICSAAIFYQWAGVSENGQILKGLLLGILGMAVISASSWVTSFVPLKAMPIIFLSGATAFFAQFFFSILEKPERDMYWVVAATGGLSALFFYRMMVVFIAT